MSSKELKKSLKLVWIKFTEQVVLAFNLFVSRYAKKIVWGWNALAALGDSIIFMVGLTIFYPEIERFSVLLIGVLVLCLCWSYWSGKDKSTYSLISFLPRVNSWGDVYVLFGLGSGYAGGTFYTVLGTSIAVAKENVVTFFGLNFSVSGYKSETGEGNVSTILGLAVGLPLSLHGKVETWFGIAVDIGRSIFLFRKKYDF